MTRPRPADALMVGVALCLCPAGGGVVEEDDREDRHGQELQLLS